MQTYIEAFDERLRSIFQKKAAEFNQYAEDEPSTSTITSQLAGLYQDLAETLSH